MRTRSYAIFKSRRFFLCLRRKKSGKTGEIDHVIEEVRSCGTEMDRDDLQKLSNSHNQEMTIDELIEMHEHQQGIKELD
ncbi:hypothetical protein TNCV_1485521 [Trichonephila clavipes]|nr:hypothetical protein TNCV_1485521 [Trichonephila clavipes]